jgi:hypothetical protein
MAGTTLRGSLQASDFGRPVTKQRRSALDVLFERQVLAEGVLLVQVYSRNGTVTYSNDHRLVGTRTGHVGHLREALGGSIRGDVTRIGGKKVLRTYAPVAVRGGPWRRRHLPGLRPDRQGSASDLPPGGRDLRGRADPALPHARAASAPRDEADPAPDGGDRAARALRRDDGPPQPDAVPRPNRPGDPLGAARARLGSSAAARCRPLQGDQRRPRPRHRRPAAEGARRAARRCAARERHARPPRR